MRPSIYKFTAEIDSQIKELYLTKVRYNKKEYPAPVQSLSEKIGIPAWRITNRARTLGLISSTGTGARWSEREIEILMALSGKSLITVQRALKKDGFKRSLSSIANKYKKEKINRSRDGYSATNLAECFGVDVRTMVSKIKSGKLKATHLGTQRTESQGGDGYLITDKNIKEYIIKYVDEVDIRKVDKFWFVSVLTSRAI